jgi:hypothetical protein
VAHATKSQETNTRAPPLLEAALDVSDVVERPASVLHQLIYGLEGPRLTPKRTLRVCGVVWLVWLVGGGDGSEQI